MKTLRRFFGLFTLILALFCFIAGIQLREKNKTLKQSTAIFSETIQEEQRLSSQNALLRKRWEAPNDVLAKLSKYLILPKNEATEDPVNIYNPENQNTIPVYENYLSGFIAYDDCVKALEKLCDAQLPILITSLSVHRNIAHNYALQISMTYRTK